MFSKCVFYTKKVCVCNWVDCVGWIFNANNNRSSRMATKCEMYMILNGFHLIWNVQEPLYALFSCINFRLFPGSFLRRIRFSLNFLKWLCTVFRWFYFRTHLFSERCFIMSTSRAFKQVPDVITGLCILQQKNVRFHPFTILLHSVAIHLPASLHFALHLTLTTVRAEWKIWRISLFLIQYSNYFMPSAWHNKLDSEHFYVQPFMTVKLRIPSGINKTLERRKSSRAKKNYNNNNCRAIVKRGIISSSKTYTNFFFPIKSRA